MEHAVAQLIEACRKVAVLIPDYVSWNFLLA
jgi:hypothetical protein